ncbi:MAG: hypothetical protein ACREUF_02090, partial [Solimonas sp.]
MDAVILSTINAAAHKAAAPVASVRLVSLYGDLPQRWLQIEWSGMVASPMAGGAIIAMRSRPAEHIMLAPARLQLSDADFVAAAWQLGAWDVRRIEHRPLPIEADPGDARWGVASAFGAPYELTGDAANAESGGDAAGLIQMMASSGWVTWLCKPLHLGPAMRLQQWGGKDRTLLPDGSRAQLDRTWTAAAFSGAG